MKLKLVSKTDNQNLNFKKLRVVHYRTKHAGIDSFFSFLPAALTVTLRRGTGHNCSCIFFR